MRILPFTEARAGGTKALEIWECLDDPFPRIKGEACSHGFDETKENWKSAICTNLYRRRFAPLIRQ